MLSAVRATRSAAIRAARVPHLAARLYSSKPDVSFDELQKIIHGVSPKPYVLVDVREPNEVAEGRVPTAVNIPLGDVAAAFAMPSDAFIAKYRIDRPSDEEDVIFYCRSGKRSQKAIDEVARVDHSLSLRNYRGSWLDYADKALHNKPLN
ncbi:hypothetical protein IWW55_004590 [Coemansia sp. RSA 2706]|nr:hypothetical protein LPJ63_000631 [Coemansia sp. RSA 2711]KAJ1843461.1 hypothetical protein LPJ70_003375 [Coemansia sp. RSA 2708]KAJ2298076.1 hypothetical protein IWW55_004590 [Coemansia sp. RSA 2706]KAJ2311483.1 hypothetical protein IWW52_005123 [Coemansia sp. RSA 2704]KAJ2361239.1 hypothetical protein H4S01_005354 [Coemansia sp. RSA 2610]KAJ2376206.1 hypothetical protein H4S02_007992 [Coemansia sp. RSA 2611]KAJ2718490.1 hypothetical protein H4R23_005008 [Coemansia sp. Cherry 401B]